MEAGGKLSIHTGIAMGRGMVQYKILTVIPCWRTRTTGDPTSSPFKVAGPSTDAPGTLWRLCKPSMVVQRYPVFDIRVEAGF